MINPDQEAAPQVTYVRSPLPPFLKWLILGLICLIILLFILYAKGYLLPAFFPKQPKTTAVISKNPALEKIVVQCPTPEEFCAKVTTLKLAFPQNRQKNDGLGWILPKNTTIKAAFEGSVKQQTIFGATPSAQLITIISPLGRYEARYIFAVDQQPDTKQNLSPNEKTVKTGDALTTIPGIPLIKSGYNGETLQFYVVDKTEGGKMVLLAPEDLKQKINLPKE